MLRPSPKRPGTGFLPLKVDIDEPSSAAESIAGASVILYARRRTTLRATPPSQTRSWSTAHITWTSRPPTPICGVLRGSTPWQGVEPHSVNVLELKLAD